MLPTTEVVAEFACGALFGIGVSVCAFGTLKGLTYCFYQRKGQQIKELHDLALDNIISWQQATMQTHKLLRDPQRPWYVNAWNDLISLTGDYFAPNNGSEEDANGPRFDN